MNVSSLRNSRTPLVTREFTTIMRANYWREASSNAWNAWIFQHTSISFKVAGSVPTSVGTRISRFLDFPLSGIPLRAGFGESGTAHERDSESGTRSTGKVSFDSASLTWAERDSSFVVTLYGPIFGKLKVGLFHFAPCEARLQGNTLFVDDGFAPYADQWKFLVGIGRLDVDTVARVVEDAAARGRIVGFEEYPAPDGVEDRSSHLAATLGPRSIVADSNVPSNVQATLSERLVIEKSGLSSPLLNDLKRLAAFANPEF